jgi:hypothetical protein
MQTTQASEVKPRPEFTGCCARFDPAPYQDNEFTWRDELFVKEHVRSLFHVPLNMGKCVVRAKTLIDAAGAQPTTALMLSDEKSPWGADLYVLVTKPVPGAEVVKLPGTYLTKVFEGPFRDAPKWANAMREYVRTRGKALEKLYFAYTTCPACAKAYGENYVVTFAKVS